MQCAVMTWLEPAPVHHFEENKNKREKEKKKIEYTTCAHASMQYVAT